MIGRLFRTLLGRSRATENDAPGEHAVIIHLPLKNGPMGSPSEREDVLALCDRLEELIAANGLGELDGHESGQGESVLYAYGPDADTLYEAIRPLLIGSAAAAGGFAIKRYGPAADPNARESKVAW